MKIGPKQSGGMTVSVVIPNWNGVHLLEKHLKSVITHAPGAEIIVVDDCSTDGSVDFLSAKFPRVRIVVGVKHKGFASNVNAGVSHASGEIVVLLNTDVRPQSGFLAPLIKHFLDETVFAVGCLEKSKEYRGTVLRGRGLARWRKGYYIHTRGEIDATDTAWVSGGSGAFRKSMWDTLGGLDDLYNPFYWEDIDISYRARKSGWKTLFESGSVVLHMHEEGAIKSKITAADIQRIAYRNQFIFIWKNVTDAGILLTHILWTPAFLFRALLSGDILMVAGFFGALARLPVILRHRDIQRRIYKSADRDLDIGD